MVAGVAQAGSLSADEVGVEIGWRDGDGGAAGDEPVMVGPGVEAAPQAAAEERGEGGSARDDFDAADEPKIGSCLSDSVGAERGRGRLSLRAWACLGLPRWPRVPRGGGKGCWGTSGALFMGRAVIGTLVSGRDPRGVRTSVFAKSAWGVLLRRRGAGRCCRFGGAGWRRRGR